MMEPPTITQEAANAAAHQKDSAEHDESEEAPLIKPISSSSIKRLVAGQAITDLSSSVKELVDNAIDASATRISIKLYNQGLECIELIDNGIGVTKSSRPYMAQRHATSKLRQFEDIYTGACAPTLGFRGEALFCLANLSRSLKVSTRTIEDESLGESFCFDTQGELIADSIVPTPRSVGTTVSVIGLMESLPVRRVDMCKRIKAQNMKLMKLMQGYAILCMGVQFTFTDVATTAAAKNKKTVVRLATSDSSKTMEARVASVLGTKFLAGLTRIELDLQSAVNDNNNDSVEAAEKNHGNNMEKWSMSGLISHSPTSPNPGNARDMQFFSINGRPVDLPSVSRVIGDVWRTFDPSIEGSGGGSKRSGRRPACVLAFTLPASMYDVNLAPDKREVMFTEETLIIGCIRDGLMKVWSEQSEGKFRANEVEKRSAVAKAANPVAKLSVTQEPSTQNEEHSSRAEESVVCDDVTPKLTRRNVTAARGDNEHGSLVTPFDSSNANKRRQSSMSTTSPPDKVDTPVNEESNSIGNAIPVQHERASPQERRGWEQTQLNFRRIEKQNLRQEMQRMLGPNDDVNKRSQHARRVEEYEAPASSIEEAAVPVRPRQSKRPKRKRNDDVTFLDKFAFGSKQEDGTESASSEKSESESDEDEAETSSSIRPASRKNVSISSTNTRGNLVGRGRATSGARVLVGRAASVMETSQASSLSKRRTQQAVVDTGKRRHSAVESSKEPVAPSAETVWGNFAGTRDVILQSQRAYLATKKNSTFLHSSLGKVETKDKDEKESTLSLCKEDIRHMSIIGQFNLGFILARDHNNNLWILDQHACDEKYNFERLCKETVIHEQKLIAPLPLELSPSEEHCVLEHMDIFERNGFRFTYDPEKDQRHRLSVTALPHSGSGGDGRKAVQFGKEDVGALCAMLGADGTSSAEGYIAGFGSGADGSGMVGNNAVRRFAGLAGSHNGSSVMRLPKAIAMFASRACRGSIMIGTALSDKDQKKILNKLDGTDDPWTCAHGRPTMCHVSCLSKQLKDDDDELTLHYTAGGSAEDC
eukprot:scaffold9069_cov134-Skeletonema_marinoi.AAC.5